MFYHYLHGGTAIRDLNHYDESDSYLMIGSLTYDMVFNNKRTSSNFELSYLKMEEILFSDKLIYCDEENFDKVVMYFVHSLQNSFSLNEEESLLILHKIKQRHFISGGLLCYPDYEKFKVVYPKYTKFDKIEALPLEIIGFLFYSDRISKSFLISKILSMSCAAKSTFLQIFAEDSIKHLFTTPSILTDYGLDFSDPFLKALYLDRNYDIFDNCKDDLIRLIESINRKEKIYTSDLGSHIREFQRINSLEFNDTLLDYNSDNFFANFMFVNESWKVNFLLIEYMVSKSLKRE